MRRLHPLPQRIPSGMRCVSIVMPDDDEYYYYLLSALARLAQQSSYQRDEQRTARLVADVWSQANALTIDSSLCEEPATVVKRIKTRLPSWLTIVGESEITIQDDCMTPVTVNIYECCGDDSSAGSGTGGGMSPSNGVYAPPPASSEAITPCDIATYTVPRILSKMSEIAQSLEQLVNAGGVVTRETVDDVLQGIDDMLPLTGYQILDNAFVFMSAMVESGLDNIITVMASPDFEFRMQTALIKQIGSRPTIESLTVQDVRAASKYLPLTWGIPATDSFVPGIRYVIESFTYLLNPSSLRIWSLSALGQGNEALCNLLYEDAGLAKPDSPIAQQGTSPIPDGSSVVDAGNGYTLVDYRINFDSSVNPSPDVPFESGWGRPVAAYFEAVSCINANHGPTLRLIDAAFEQSYDAGFNMKGCYSIGGKGTFGAIATIQQFMADYELPVSDTAVEAPGYTSAASMPLSPPIAIKFSLTGTLTMSRLYILFAQ